MFRLPLGAKIGLAGESYWAGTRRFERVPEKSANPLLCRRRDRCPTWHIRIAEPRIAGAPEPQVLKTHIPQLPYTGTLHTCPKDNASPTFFFFLHNLGAILIG